jgi:HEAT repeat protein
MKIMRAAENYEVRQNGTDALGKIGPAAEKAVHELINALSDEDYEVRQNAVNVLGQIGPAAEKTVPFLIKALSLSYHYSYDVRRTAVDALGANRTGC